MSSITFDLKSYYTYLQSVDLMPALKRGIYSGALASLPILHEKTEGAPPASKHGGIGATNTRAYLKAWKARKASFGAVILNDKPYSPIIEDGATYASKIPPKKALAEWAQRRLGLSKDAARAAAWPIAKAIAKRGLRARNVLKNARKELKAVVHQDIKKEIDLYLTQGNP